MTSVTQRHSCGREGSENSCQKDFCIKSRPLENVSKLGLTVEGYEAKISVD